MCKVYSKLVKYFATIATPLNKLFEKTASASIENLTDVQQQSFDNRKSRLPSTPFISIPRGVHHINLIPKQTRNKSDASAIKHTLQRTFYTLDTFWKHWWTEKKLGNNWKFFVIIWEVLPLQLNLEGTGLTLSKDQSLLKWLFGGQFSRKRANWSLWLKEFDFNVE